MSFGYLFGNGESGAVAQRSRGTKCHAARFSPVWTKITADYFLFIHPHDHGNRPVGAGIHTFATAIAFVLADLYGHSLRVSCQGMTRTGEDAGWISLALHTGIGF
ncbi:MAG: hypothetical protein PVG99_11775 [Desulfobacteraceae bacterium]